jgi:glutathione S-transferase
MASTAIEIYWGSGSPFAWRVLLALEHKQLPYQSHLLQFSKGEHKTPAYLALNPRGQVPTLRDDTLVVHESVAILAYLERRYPERPLFGTSPAETAAIWQRVMESVTSLDATADAFILPIYFNRLPAQAAEVKAAVPLLHAELGRIEAALGSHPWLCGDALSAADFATYPMVKSIARAAGKPAGAELEGGLRLLPERYPQTAAWMARIEALPYYERTFPPHWRA